MNIEYYTDKINQNAGLIAEAKRNVRLLVVAKLVSFVLLAFSAYQWAVSPGVLWPLLTLLFLTLYTLFYRKGMRYDEQLDFARKVNRCHQQEISALQRDFSSFDNGERFADPTHEYSYDLDLFGSDSLFHRIDRTVSEAGATQLATLFTRLPDKKETVDKRQKAVSELGMMNEWCTHFRAYGQGSSIDMEKTIQALHSDTLPNIGRNKAMYAAMILSVCLTISTIVLAFCSILPAGIASVAFTLQLFICLIFSKSLYATAAKVGNLHKAFHHSWQLLLHIQSALFTSSLNKRARAQLIDGTPNAIEAFRKLSSLLSQMDSRSNALGMVLFDGLFLRDLFIIRRYHEWKKVYLPHLPEWLNTLATMDAMVSLANYQFNHPDNIRPQLNEDPLSPIEATDLRHPFIPAEKAVGNDFKLTATEIAIITGANMAGKSTFLRTIGINYIMAACGLNVCARELHFPLLKLFTGMRTTDNLNKNISFFHAELIRLEQLINYCNQQPHTLVILDEILKGTNSKDKLKGSRLFLTQTAKLNIRGIVATHDLELSQLEQEDKRFRNLCFEIELNDDATYSYKIESGVAHNMNATFLLNKILNKASL